MTKPVSAVERRTVLLAGGAVATTTALTGCVIKQEAPPVATQPQPRVSSPQPESPSAGSEVPTDPPLAQVADIPAGGGVVLKEQKVVLTKDGSGKIAAFSAVCTHQGCAVTDVTGGTINCPCHKSKFDAASGERVAGPAKKPLPSVAVVERNGAVYQA
ncbi:Rieske (2Fe-2S) protein [Kribbella albertanoniae]|uniref:Cytochrome bc1 complex Rieske iron-sulfur subunit n=1 Tax=Kribbella albertanoniae TaxID=1266829 RepID=A0A4R4QER3_9ACTN|nr:Rieske (2Fe-2S) protein [Kribbella albertanoniae]TDC34017.1 Rieske (2Fe-2S) protein [Kribbella albertanoniae]